MKRLSFLFMALLCWESIQASDLVSLQYQSVMPANTSLQMQYADARIGIYCVYRSGDARDSLLVMQFAQNLREECLLSPAISVVKGINFELLPLGSEESMVSEQVVKDLAAADSLDYILIIDRFTIKLSQLVFLSYQVDYRIYDSNKNRLQSEKEVRKLSWINEVNEEAFMIEIVAAYFAKEIMPSWATHNRALYEGYGAEARKALKAAQNFKWQDALPIWIQLSNVPNDERAAEMYYNLAIGMEAAGEYELAYKWMKQSIAAYNLDDYQGSVLAQILNKMKLLEAIRFQMNTPIVSKTGGDSSAATNPVGIEALPIALSIEQQLEGSYSAVLPANPGNFSSAKLSFSNGIPKVFIDDYSIAVKKCVFSDKSALLQIDVMGEEVSIEVFPDSAGIKGTGWYDDMKMPFKAKRDHKN